MQLVDGKMQLKPRYEILKRIVAQCTYDARTKRGLHCTIASELYVRQQFLHGPGLDSAAVDIE